MNEEERELDLALAECETENKMLRARNERLMLELDELVRQTKEMSLRVNQLENLMCRRHFELQHYSDCAVHSEPAYPKGECDCGGYIPEPKAVEWVLDWLAQQHFDQCREERPIQDWIRKMKSQLPDGSAA